MKDATNYILQQLYTLLNGNISYNSNIVPFYAFSQDPEETDNLFANVSSSFVTPFQENKDHFIRSYTINVDIVHIQTVNVVTEKAVNYISNQITTLVKPSKYTFGIADSNDFKVVNITSDTARLFVDDIDNRKVIRKVIDLEFHIKQI